MPDRAGRTTPAQRSVDAEVAYLLSARAVRERANALFELGVRDALPTFRVDLGAMDGVVDFVHRVIAERYPSFDVPLHARFRHFEAGGVPRLPRLDAALAGASPTERALAKVDLVVASVLLDAGAGAAWRYVEPGTGLVLARSEGLAVASLDLFLGGALASDGRAPRADAAGLDALSGGALAAAFQVGPSNPIVGLEGRLALLRGLARAVRERAEARGGDGARARPSDAVRALVEQAPCAVTAESLLGRVLDAFGSIWPGRIALRGTNLGDVWHHPALGPEGSTAALVPFHKLSQWLTYSLVEPLVEVGVAVTDLDGLTGLPEYRNGGLFVDLGVLVPRDTSVLTAAHEAGSPTIVEWRALTVALLDRVADALRGRLGLGRDVLPLAKVLEGGTWAAGRLAASERRPGGTPPIALASDGTVF